MLTSESPDRVRLLKKYPNRRLYDTDLRRYVTLAEVAAWIRDGSTVRVVDHPGGRDVTRAVLVQVIAETEGGLDMLPPELLHLLVRAHGTLHQAPLTAFLHQGIQRFLTLAGAWADPLGAWTRTVARAEGSGSASESSPAAASPDRTPPDRPLDADLERARRTMDSLLGRLRG